MTAKQLNIKNRTYYFYIIKALNFEPINLKLIVMLTKINLKVGE